MDAKFLKIELEQSDKIFSHISSLMNNPYCYFVYDDNDNLQGVCYYRDLIRNLKNWKIPYSVSYKLGRKVDMNEYDLSGVSFNKLNQFKSFLDGKIHE